jgi:hypothetical protein
MCHPPRLYALGHPCGCSGSGCVVISADFDMNSPPFRSPMIRPFRCLSQIIVNVKKVCDAQLPHDHWH